MTLSPDEFECGRCLHVFIKGWTDEEATSEFEELWPGEAKEDLTVVCDPCFQTLVAIAIAERLVSVEPGEPAPT